MTARILVVEDSATVRHLVEAVLRGAGYSVETAVDGVDGLERVHRSAFDLALVDFVMPRLNGYQFAQALRGIPGGAELPVVLMSARAESIGARFGQQTGAVATLVKPFTPTALLELVRVTLERARVESSAFTSIVAAPTEPPGSLSQRGVRLAQWVAGPEAARDRLLDLLVRHVGPVVREIVEAGVDAHDDLLSQAFRHHVSMDAAMELAREARTLDPSLRGPAGLEGVLGVVSLAQVVRLIEAAGLHGVLRVERAAKVGSAAMEMRLRPGLIDQVVGLGVGAEHRLGRHLVGGGALPRSALDAFIASGASRGSPLGRALVAARRISEEHLRAALASQTLELFGEASRWSGGRFRFVPGEGLAVGDAALGIGAEDCIADAERRATEWESIEALVPMERAVALRETGVGVAHDLDSRRVLAAVDGERSVREIARELELSPMAVGRALVGLLRARAISVVPPMSASS
jgi:CheY-like chemotaxis protein